MYTAEASSPDPVFLALHCMARGDLGLPQQAGLNGEWLTARFQLDDIGLKNCDYYDSVSLYGHDGAQLELIALDKRRPVHPGGEACIRVRIGT